MHEGKQPLCRLWFSLIHHSFFNHCNLSHAVLGNWHLISGLHFVSVVLLPPHIAYVLRAPHIERRLTVNDQQQLEEEATNFNQQSRNNAFRYSSGRPTRGSQ